MFGLDFQFEQISFFLGFIAASLFWWLIFILRKSWPRVKEFIIQQREIEKKRRVAGLDAQLREAVLQRAQKMHIASALFPLDDILIIPTLLAPPPVIDPDSQDAPDPFSRAIPYLPQCPELASNLGGPTLSLPQAIQNKTDIAILGQPGSGKTVALAYLASLLARRSASSASSAASPIPFLLHVLNLRTEILDKKDPLECLTKALSADYPLLVQRQLPRRIDDLLQDNNFLVLLDGFDELSPMEAQDITRFLKALKEKYSSIQIVLTSSPEYLDGILELGMTPLALTTWNNEQVHEYMDHWGKSWMKYIAPMIQKQSQVQFPHPFLLTSWLLASPNSNTTPLELTARIWSVYAGDISGGQSTHALQSLSQRLTGKNIPVEAFGALANLILSNYRASISYSEAEKYLSKFRTTINVENPAGNTAEVTDTAAAASEAPNRRPTVQSKEQKIGSSGSQIISQMLNAGLLNEYSGGNLAFANPLLTGFFSTFTDSISDESHSDFKPAWSAQLSQYHFLTAIGRCPEKINQLLQRDSAPLFTNTLTTIRWLKDAPTSSESRSMVMRKFVQLIQMSDIPLSIRIGLMTAAATSNDPAVANLCRQFLQSPDPRLRQLAVIGAGLCRDVKSIGPVTELLADIDENVKFTACYALASIGTPTAWEAVTSALQFGDEELRMAVGQTLAANKIRGPEILKEAIHSEDILVRRAAVFGIARINEPWSIQILEKIAVEDGQWVVRNAAGHALEDRYHSKFDLPQKQTPPHELPWLLAYAGKHGVGLAPNQSARPMLMDALQNGTTLQKVAALPYLMREADAPVIHEITRAAMSTEPNLQSAAVLALWFLWASGIELTAAR